MLNNSEQTERITTEKKFLTFLRRASKEQQFKRKKLIIEQGQI